MAVLQIPAAGSGTMTKKPSVIRKFTNDPASSRVQESNVTGNGLSAFIYNGIHSYFWPYKNSFEKQVCRMSLQSHGALSTHLLSAKISTSLPTKCALPLFCALTFTLTCSFHMELIWSTVQAE